MYRVQQGAASVALADGSRNATRPLFLALCAGAFCASLAETIYFCRSMAGGMAMPGGWTMSMMWMRMPGQTWFSCGALFLLLWLAMMVAMMLSSAMLMLVHYRRSLPH